MSPSCPERSRGVSTAFLPRAKPRGTPGRAVAVSPLFVAFLPRAKPRGTPGRAVAVSPLFVAFLPRAKPRGTPNRPLTPLSTAFTQTHRGVGDLPSLFLATRLPRSSEGPLATRHSPLSSPLCFHTLANSLSLSKKSTPLQSSKSTLFRKNTRGWGIPKLQIRECRFKTGGPTSPHYRRRRLCQASAAHRRPAAAARGLQRSPASEAARWLPLTMAR